MWYTCNRYKNGKNLPFFTSSLMKQQPQDIQKLFLELYEAFNDEIFRFSLSRTRNRDLALDITQETFTKTWDYLRSGKTIDSVRGFLYKICRNLIIDHSRKRSFESLDALFEHSSLAEPVDISQQPSGAELDKEYLLQILKQLPEHHYEILVLRYIQELTLSEIANAYKESENTISVRIHRATKHAQQLMGSHTESYEI